MNCIHWIVRLSRDFNDWIVIVSFTYLFLLCLTVESSWKSFLDISNFDFCVSFFKVQHLLFCSIVLIKYVGWKEFGLHKSCWSNPALRNFCFLTVCSPALFGLNRLTEIGQWGFCWTFAPLWLLVFVLVFITGH